MLNLNENELGMLQILLKHHIEDESFDNINEMRFLIELYEKIHSKWYEIKTIDESKKKKAKLN